jgi:rod shape-determining protein MreB
VDPDYQDRVRNNVILSGGTALIRGFGARLQTELGQFGGGRVKVVKDPVYVGADGGLAIALDASEEEWERLAS